MKTVKGIKAAALLAATVLGAPAFAEPISRTAEAEIIAGYDFAVYQQLGDDFQRVYSDPNANFPQYKSSAARFSFTIESDTRGPDQCFVHIITWNKQISPERRAQLNSGGSLDASYLPGLAGYITADKTVFTGGGAFTAKISPIEADFFGPSAGEPGVAALPEEIIQSAQPGGAPISFPSPYEFPPSYGPPYNFAESFQNQSAGNDLRWRNVQGSWGDARYSVFTVSCTALITIPAAPADSEPGGSDTSPADVSGVADAGPPSGGDNPNSGGNARIWPLIAAAVILLGGILFALVKRSAAKTAGRIASRTGGQSARHAPKAKPRRPEQSGVVFAGSPMVAGAVAPGAAPLAPAGTMVSSGLQTLTGAYAALKPAYRATGRIGGPQEGVPTNDDVAFGTGFLVTPNHVMTNQHVWEFYKHYLAGTDCGGIEFIAERDRDASDYVAFNGEPPVIIKDLDIAIFTLARPVTDRMPIDRIAAPAQSLDGREVVTVSYPCPFETDETILAVVEPDPIFAVKRLSEGKIFRHSTDTDAPYGVDVPVDPAINPAKAIAAICHNASTLGGSSGAPILDRQGRLVGVHFAGKRSFNEAEAANLAMAIDRIAAIDLKSKQT